MGKYVNPGMRAFSEIADAEYVDQTGLIHLINQTMLTKNKLTCVCRPRGMSSNMLTFPPWGNTSGLRKCPEGRGWRTWPFCQRNPPGYR